MLHNPAFRSTIESRLNALRLDAPRKWGKLTSDQMLGHVNQFLAFSLGDGSVERMKIPMPLPIFRFMLLHLPWLKGAPTHPNAVAKGAYDFAAERARRLALTDRFANRPPLAAIQQLIRGCCTVAAISE